MKSAAIQFVRQQTPGLPTPATLNLWWRRYTTRHQLRQMRQLDPDRLRNDLGLTDEALALECNKWFWEA